MSVGEELLRILIICLWNRFGEWRFGAVRSVLFDPDFVIVETMDGQEKGEKLILFIYLKKNWFESE